MAASLQPGAAAWLPGDRNDAKGRPPRLRDAPPLFSAPLGGAAARFATAGQEPLRQVCSITSQVGFLGALPIWLSTQAWASATLPNRAF